MEIHEYYNVERFPILVAHHGNWDIFRNDQGQCAAIPVVEGCKASYFGDMAYLKHVPDLVYVTDPRLTSPSSSGEQAHEI